MFENINFLKDAKIVRVSNSAVAATSLITTAAVDTEGFNSVAFVAALGDVTSGSVLLLTALTVATNTNSGGTASADTAGYTAGATDADNLMIAVDMNKPRQRYAYATLARGTQNAVIDGIFAILYNAQERPVTQDATLLASKSTNDSA